MKIKARVIFLTKETVNDLKVRSDKEYLRIRNNPFIIIDNRRDQVFPDYMMNKIFQLKVVKEAKDDGIHSYYVQYPEEILNVVKEYKIPSFIFSSKSKVQNPSKKLKKLTYTDIPHFIIEGQLGYITENNEIVLDNQEITKTLQQERKKRSDNERSKNEQKKIARDEAIETYVDLHSQKFVFPKGFSSILELVEAGESIYLYKNQYAIIKLFEQYYGVCFDTWNKQFVLAENHVYAREESGHFKKMKYDACKLPYKHYSRSKRESITYLAEEVIALDENLEIFIYEKKNSETYTKVEDLLEMHNYLIILGAISFERYYTYKTKNNLKHYFKNAKSYEELLEKSQKDAFVIAINPFKQKAIMSNGKKIKFEYISSFRGGVGHYRIPYR